MENRESLMAKTSNNDDLLGFKWQSSPYRVPNYTDFLENDLKIMER